MLPRRERPLQPDYDRSGLRQASEVPGPVEIRGVRETARASSARSALRRRPRSASPAQPRRRRDSPPGATHARSSSKNGIMLSSVTSSKAPSAEGQRRRVGLLEADAASELGRRLSARLPTSPSRGRRRYLRLGQRRASDDATAPVSVPRSSTRAGDRRPRRARSRTRRRCSGPRSVSHAGASRSNCQRIGPQRAPEPGQRTAAFVARRGEAPTELLLEPLLMASAGGSGLRCPAPRRHVGRAAAADRDRDVSVRVLVEDEVAARASAKVRAATA